MGGALSSSLPPLEGGRDGGREDEDLGVLWGPGKSCGLGDGDVGGTIPCAMAVPDGLWGTDGPLPLVPLAPPPGFGGSAMGVCWGWKEKTMLAGLELALCTL